MKAYIEAISYYLPELILSNKDLADQFPEWTAEKIGGKLGISERRIVSREELSSDMAVVAGNKLFEENKIDRTSVDFLLLCTQSPDYFLPTTACIIQDRLKLPTSCGALDFNLGCSGFVYGLALAKGLISGGIAKKILLITAETYSRFMHPDDKSNKAIFGDAAAATLISTEGFASIEDFSLGTDGAGAGNLIVRNGALRGERNSNSDDLDNYLHMNGTEIFNFTLDAVPKLVIDTLKKNKESIEDIDYFIFHQANKYMLNFLRKKIGIAENKFLYFLDNCGNTVSSTIPICLQEHLQLVKDSSAKKVLLAGFGVGYSWAGVILTLKK